MLTLAPRMLECARHTKDKCERMLNVPAASACAGIAGAIRRRTRKREMETS
jgi:hypothetical protein